MPREVLDIREFKNWKTNADSYDLDPSIGINCVNIEPTDKLGVLRSMKTDVTYYDEFGDYYPALYSMSEGVFLTDDTGRKHLIFIVKSGAYVGLHQIFDFNGTGMTYTQLDTSPCYSLSLGSNCVITGRGNALPKWTGYCQTNNFIRKTNSTITATMGTSRISLGGTLPATSRTVRITKSVDHSTVIYNYLCAGIRSVTGNEMQLSWSSESGVSWVPADFRTSDGYCYVKLTGLSGATRMTRYARVTYMYDDYIDPNSVWEIKVRFPDVETATLWSVSDELIIETFYDMAVVTIDGVDATIRTELFTGNRLYNDGFQLYFYGDVGGISVGQYWQVVTAADTAVTKSLYTTDNFLHNPFSIYFVGKGVTGATTFPHTKKYSYKLSAIYDGFQESQLSAAKEIDLSDSSNDYRNIFVTIKILTADLTNKRITGIGIYRAEATTSDTYYGYYKNVGSIAFESESFYYTKEGSDLAINFVDSSDGGYNYEDLNGIPETYTDNTMYFELSTFSGGYLFTGVNYKASIRDEAKYMIFRSIASKPSLFRWTEEFIKLKEVPTAMVSYMDILYIFTQNYMYRVNPADFYIIEEIFGMGVSDKKYVKVTKEGIVLAQENGCFILDGKTLNEISKDIYDYYKTVRSGFVSILSNTKNRIILFTFSDTVVKALGYSLLTNSWFLYTITSAKYPVGGFEKDSNSYVVMKAEDETGIMANMFEGNTYRDMIWQTPHITFGDVAQDKKVYTIGIEYSGSVSLTMSINKASFTSTTNSPKRVKSISLQISSTGGTLAEIKNIELVYRLLRGKQ